MIDQQTSDLLGQAQPSIPSGWRAFGQIATKALLWAVASAVATTVLFEAFVVALAVFAAHGGRTPLSLWIVNLSRGTLGHLIVILLLQLPLTFFAGSFWISAVRRQPHLDGSRRNLLFGCLIVGIPPAVAFWTFVSAAHHAAPDETVENYMTATKVLTTAIIYLGVLLPRFVVPGLKQGQLVPTLIKSPPEHVK